MLNRTLYALFHLFRFLVIALPRPLAGKLADGIAFLFYRLDARHRKIVLANLEFAFGDEYSPQEREALAQKCFRNFAHYLIDFAAFMTMNREDLLKRARFEGGPILDEAAATGRPIIFVGAHYCNWEFMTKAIIAAYRPIASPAAELENSPLLNAWLDKSRRKFGTIMFDRRGALRSLMKILKKNEHWVGMLVDQNTNLKNGVNVEFFSKKTTHYSSASQLARKFDAILLPVFASTDDYETYTVTFYDPLPVPKTDDPEADILAATQAQAEITEKVIRERPDQYFWFHKRWKKHYPEMYRNLR